MIDNDILCLVLAFLAFAMTLTLSVALAVLASARHMAEGERPLTLPLGEPIPDVQGRALLTRERMPVTSRELPSVLLFLSSTCPKCRQKLPEIERFLPLLEDAGLAIRFLSREPKWRLKRFIGGTTLAGITQRISTRDFKALNPTMSSPYYMFVDQHGVLQAGGLIGDENWLGFVEQMAELDEAA